MCFHFHRHSAPSCSGNSPAPTSLHPLPRTYVTARHNQLLSGCPCPLGNIPECAAWTDIPVAISSKASGAAPACDGWRDLSLGRHDSLAASTSAGVSVVGCAKHGALGQKPPRAVPRVGANPCAIHARCTQYASCAKYNVPTIVSGR